MARDLALAIEALCRIEKEPLTCVSAVAEAARSLTIRNRNIISKAQVLVRNVLHRKNFIDYLLTLALAPASLHTFSLDVQALLRLFVLHVKFQSKEITTAISLAQAGRSSLGWKRVLPIETVFGKILQLQLNEAIANLDDLRKISFQTFVPEWFVGYCVRLLGRREALRFLRSSPPSPIFIRLNTIHDDESLLYQQHQETGFALHKVDAIPFLYQITENENFEKLISLETYMKGAFAFQEKSSSVASLISDPQVDQTILIVGVEITQIATYIAQLLGNKGRILALASSPHQLARINHEAHRQGFKNIETQLMPVKELDQVFCKADLIVYNPRNSQTGVFWRRPAIKWKTHFKTVLTMAQAQSDSLAMYAKYLPTNGYLVYWTQSVTVEENELILERFLKQHPEFTLMSTSPYLGVAGFRGQSTCQRLYPHLHAADGSFFAKLQKQ
jgi:16S rRNA (cytosine967-C5)-methyltransferase